MGGRALAGGPSQDMENGLGGDALTGICRNAFNEGDLLSVFGEDRGG